MSGDCRPPVVFVPSSAVGDVMTPREGFAVLRERHNNLAAMLMAVPQNEVTAALRIAVFYGGVTAGWLEIAAWLADVANSAEMRASLTVTLEELRRATSELEDVVGGAATI